VHCGAVAAPPLPRSGAGPLPVPGPFPFPAGLIPHRAVALPYGAGAVPALMGSIPALLGFIPRPLGCHPICGGMDTAANGSHTIPGGFDTAAAGSPTIPRGINTAAHGIHPAASGIDTIWRGIALPRQKTPVFCQKCPPGREGSLLARRTTNVSREGCEGRAGLGSDILPVETSNLRAAKQSPSPFAPFARLNRYRIISGLAQGSNSTR
jgi:hypothetical protein